MSELLPCPFHGEEQPASLYTVHQIGDDQWFARYGCRKCGVNQSALGATRDEALAAARDAWNTRYEPTCTYDPSDEDPDIRILRCSNCRCGMHFRPIHCPACGYKVVRR